MSETRSVKAAQVRRFSDEFKQDAVRLVTQEKHTITEAAKGKWRSPRGIVLKILPSHSTLCHIYLSARSATSSRVQSPELTLK